MLVSIPNIFDLVFTVPTFFKILGINHTLCHQFLFTSFERLSFEAPDMNAQLLADNDLLQASSRSFRLRIAERGGFWPREIDDVGVLTGGDVQPGGMVETSRVPIWSEGGSSFAIRLDGWTSEYSWVASRPAYWYMTWYDQLCIPGGD
jgi:hypothetical protein